MSSVPLAPTWLYVATTSAGKLRDFCVAATAVSARFQIEPLPGMDALAVAPEEGATFAENACSKAEFYSARVPGKIILADDSGLEVEALAGEPGVRSARFAADAGFRPDLPVDAANNLLLLERMRSIPAARRSACYRCVLAAARDGRILASAEGSVAGEILAAPRGSGGFGYDPLFFLPGQQCTMAEIDLETKHRLSHRGHALRALLALLPG
jgi:XTP/dITP diphosphohydrolase